jgi:hypothetical protein
MTYTARKPRLAPPSEELRARIPGRLQIVTGRDGSRVA